MDLKQLACFVRVAELGSFTRAAVALGVAEATPAVAQEYLQILLAHLLLTDREVRVGPLIAEPVVEREKVFPEHLPEELSLPIELHNLLFFDTR